MENIDKLASSEVEREPLGGLKLVDLQELRNALLAQAENLAKRKRSAKWWCVSGYADILNRALRDILLHERRALTTYGGRATLFDDALNAGGNQDAPVAHSDAPEGKT